MAATIQPISSPLFSSNRTPNPIRHKLPAPFPLSHSTPQLRLRRLRLRTLIPLSTPSDTNSDPDQREQPSTNDDDDSLPSTSSGTEEIKEKLAEARARAGEGQGFWGGVAEEVGEIEWPVFGKVLGTTGVVISVIAGSSIALLTVNVVLAEISDRVFAGKGVQDFFS